MSNQCFKAICSCNPPEVVEGYPWVAPEGHPAASAAAAVEARIQASDGPKMVEPVVPEDFSPAPQLQRPESLLDLLEARVNALEIETLSLKGATRGIFGKVGEALDEMEYQAARHSNRLAALEQFVDERFEGTDKNIADLQDRQTKAEESAGFDASVLRHRLKEIDDKLDHAQQKFLTIADLLELTLARLDEVEDGLEEHSGNEDKHFSDSDLR